MGILDRDYMRRDYVPKAARKMKTPPGRGGMPYWPILVAGVLFIAGGIYLSVRSANSGHKPVSQRVIEKNTRPATESPVPLIDINTATLDQIRGITSISEATAKAIIDKRPFKSWGDLDAVYGIGPKRLELLQQHCLLGKTEGQQ